MKDLMLRLLPDAANSDGEFALAARMWDADAVFASGDEAVRFVMRAGRMGDVTAVAADTAATIRVRGPADGWATMLEATPPAFYHDLFAAAARHGFTIEGKIEDVYPYYAALRRLIELLRGSGVRQGAA
jgi:hypothetical protein